MSSHRHLPVVVRELTSKSNLFSLTDFSQLWNLSAEECAEVLAAFVASGVLRKTMTEDGEVFFWLVQDPDEKQAVSL